MKRWGELAARYALWSLAGLTLACGSSDENAASAPTRESTARIQPPPPNQSPAVPVRVIPRAMTPTTLPPAPEPTEYVIVETVPAAPPPPEAPPERDLGAELRTAIGDIQSCLDVETARSLHGTLSVSVSTTVLPSGTMSRASVSAPLPEAARNCIRDRALHASLGPVERAPRSIATTLTYEVEASAPAGTVRTFAPDYIPPGATAPGVTLPALGGAPPPGAQAPGLVLPARVP